MGLSNVPKAPKPKVDIPKMPKITLGKEGQDIRNLKKKPKALAKAQEAKKKSDTKTLAKLPGGKKSKNMGEGEVYHVKGGKKRTPEQQKLWDELTNFDFDSGGTKPKSKQVAQKGKKGGKGKKRG